MRSRPLRVISRPEPIAAITSAHCKKADLKHLSRLGQLRARGGHVAHSLAFPNSRLMRFAYSG
jgi:hypothetical protein